MDDFGITYIIDNAQQFWTEIEDILQIPEDASLAQLDATLVRFVSFCSSYHEHYLQTPVQLEHACSLLLQCDLFTFHSERMRERLLDDAQKATDPHLQLILYQILLQYGRNHPGFLRSHKKWQPLLPLLMDHVLLDFDPEVEDFAQRANWTKSLPAPIEAKLRILSVGILYEVCRVQKFSVSDLRVFDDTFIDYLFELVEQTRHMQDETLNYSLIKLIVALNEQFMVASVPSSHGHGTDSEGSNRIISVLTRRLNSSKTFGENMIFMLNRAGRSPEDLCMQLLILKILYILFTTKGTSEYFYTNDLRVLVDVFLRELVDLDEDSESLRHTYLRVLHPLLTRTQLRTTPYKRPQIVRTLESLISHPEIREINATTKRLVDRCLSGDWCVQLRRVDSPTSGSGSDSGFPSFPTFKVERVDSMSGAESGPEFKPKEKVHVLKTSKSVENVRKVKHGSERIGGTSNGHTSTMNLQDMSNALPTAYSTPASPAGRNPPHRSSTFTEGSRIDCDSETSLPSSISSLDQLASASTPQTQSPIRRSSISRPQAHTRHSHNPSTSSSTSSNKDVFNGINSLGQVVESIIAPAPLHSSQSYTHTHARKGSSSSNFSNGSPFGSASSISINSDPGSLHQSQMKETQTKSRRAAPPAPPKRRKPPAIPTSKTAGGATMVTIATSGAVSPPLPSSTSSHRMVPSPLSRAFS